MVWSTLHLFRFPFCSIEADSFISALRRFINRQGKVRELRSDRGTNFVGARNELADALQELDRDRVQDFLGTKDLDWICFNFNVPASSHMGGVWERLIRTVRSVLSILLQEQGGQLDRRGFTHPNDRGGECHQ